MHFQVHSEEALDIMMDSWTPGTRSQYESGLSKWFEFCGKQGIDPFQASHHEAMGFLATLFSTSELKYSAMGTIRSAISSVIPKAEGTSFGKNPMVSRLMKGIFRRRPALPKYTVQWDVNIVLDYFIRMSQEECTLKFLVSKLATLLCILSGQRVQSLGLLKLEFMHLDNSRAVFYIPDMTKTSRPGFHIQPLEFEVFPQIQAICPVSCLKEYLEVSGRGEGKPKIGRLFLSYAPPHNPILSGTIAKYVVSILEAAGIDIVSFSAHSCRGAATSAAAQRGLSMQQIQKAAGWTNARTFAQHYQRKVEQSMSTCLLERAKDSSLVV